MQKAKGKLRIGLTDSGRVILGGTVFVALASLIVPAFGVLSALVSVLLVALLVGLVLQPRIEISADLPDRVITGQIARLRYTVRNIGRWPIYNLSVIPGRLPDIIEQAEERRIVSHLKPGETAEVTIEIRPTHRGYYRITSPVCQSSFPFNLFNIGVAGCAEDTLIVLPVFWLLQTNRRRYRRYVCTDGVRAGGRVGVSTEYAGNRPFLPGDSLRTVDTRAWARLSVPATKEYHEDSDSYCALVLDTSAAKVLSRSKSNEIKELEAAVSLCASAAFSINNDSLVDILIVGADLHQFTSLPRTLRIEKIHEILAGAKPSKGLCTKQTIETFTEQLAGISEVFFILPDWDKARRRLVEIIEEAGCHCTVLIVSEQGGANWEQASAKWTGDIRLLSPDEILAGHIRHL